MSLYLPADRTRNRLKPQGAVPGTDSDGSHRGRPSIVVLLERPKPRLWSLRQVAGLARRLGAELLIAALVTYDRGFDELDQIKLRIARDGVQDATERLLQQGVQAAGVVRLVGDGDQALSASDLADHMDANLVVVLARRGSWFRLFPGSALAHQLMRRGRRPVLVIPDHDRQGSWRTVLLGLVGVRTPRG